MTFGGFREAELPRPAAAFPPQSTFPEGQPASGDPHKRKKIAS
ncbi:unnamed protein product [Ciceribacter sp. T2.26MG-112.2]|nr:unnamed protein product [Ciceribacter naphthalenivorans]